MLVAEPAHADWWTTIEKDGDGSDMAVMQGSAQYNFVAFLLCKKDSQKHVMLQWGDGKTPTPELKTTNDLTLTIKTDEGVHTSTGVWSDYGTGHEILEYANLYETNEIADFIGRSKDTVTFIFDSPSLKVHDGVVSFANGAADAAAKFTAFCPN
ncbi:MAG: hypothetical protein WDM94_01665 [Bauldia sp.]